MKKLFLMTLFLSVFCVCAQEESDCDDVSQLVKLLQKDLTNDAQQKEPDPDECFEISPEDQDSACSSSQDEYIGPDDIQRIIEGRFRMLMNALITNPWELFFGILEREGVAQDGDPCCVEDLDFDYLVRVQVRHFVRISPDIFPEGLDVDEENNLCELVTLNIRSSCEGLIALAEDLKQIMNRE